MQLTTHFSLEELSVTNTSNDNVVPDSLFGAVSRLAQLLEMCRSALNVPLRVTSGYRSQAVNAKVGGARNSAHLYGRAADFVLVSDSWTLREAFERLRSDESIPYDQIILEPAWIHIAIAAAGASPRRSQLVARAGQRGMVYEAAK